MDELGRMLASMVGGVWFFVKLVLLFVLLCVSGLAYLISPALGFMIFLVFVFGVFVVIVSAIFSCFE